MTNNISSIQAIIQNLKDAGCSPKTVEQFMSLQKEGNTEEQLKLLSLQRRHLLDRVHLDEKRIDCLDYLVYQINKNR